MHQVLYYSRNGKARKVADAIAGCPDAKGLEGARRFASEMVKNG